MVFYPGHSAAAAEQTGPFNFHRCRCCSIGADDHRIYGLAMSNPVRFRCDMSRMRFDDGHCDAAQRQLANGCSNPCICTAVIGHIVFTAGCNHFAGRISKQNFRLCRTAGKKNGYNGNRSPQHGDLLVAASF